MVIKRLTWLSVLALSIPVAAAAHHSAAQYDFGQTVKIEGVVKAPGSAKEYEWAKVAGNANPPDWFPDEHPPAPRAVAGGAGGSFGVPRAIFDFFDVMQD